ncbi:MAG TPA: hypothetical protein VL244_03210 [Alphaproteobacteria bacterium]|nr:hypothetical protein [Alphaproteobacteria bacterium]
MWRIAAGIALGLLMLGPAGAAQLPGWVTNQSGCRAWSAVMQPNRNFSWSGGCPNGLVNGQGVLQWYDNGTPSDRYEGEVRDGKMNGRGIYFALDGERYDGEFKDDARTGHGIYLTRWGDRYEGNFERSVLQGPGSAVFANGARYEGGFWNNRANGEGTLQLADGSAVTGTWVNGCLRQGERRYAVGVGAEVSKCP